ncbi:MAG: zinc ribbon domain-containing protein [Bacillota bacterium]|nr:zinc ribbon domain-containing protein [Bacillota bacterium]HOB90544.1 zinc ribbon domain-containing protein [Bacillota bacterium]HPZ53610.1 zinc ribbon domain-containing protein [Bacillota bacterium]HQD17171.1 zinc ribbon domain-containing protein [Bacillota bacterium]
MPIFEYKCNQCGNKFEKLVRSSNEQIACPSCNSEDVRKLFSTFAAHGTASGSSGCASCSGGSCSTCH